MLGIGEEAGIFLQAMLAGIAVIGAYQCLRVLRRIVKHGLFAITIEDFLFWTGTALYLFVQIYYTSDGSIRWFFVLGVAFGMILFSAVIQIVKKIWRKLYGKIYKKNKKSVDKLK